MRISTTTLEAFRLWSVGDWMPESDLQATIRGEFVPTHGVLLGKAFGQVLETPETYRTAGGFQCDTFFFPDATMLDPLALMDRSGAFEAKATTTYGRHTVVAKADQVVGARLIEHKTTLSTFDFDRYAASYQWRFMADIFQPVSITYHVFCLSEERDGSIALRGIESFNLYPYAELHQDCCDLVRRFVDYVVVRGLDSLLEAREQAAVVA
jgi:hypothetical protein